MAYYIGKLRKYYNQNVVDTIAQGNGSQTSFSAELGRLTVTSLEIDYTIASTPYTATTDSGGNITGTNLSGTVDSDGSLSLTFTVAPDNGTDIDADRDVLGFVQTIKDKFAANSYTRIIGTGNGSQTVFTDTLPQTTVANGQCGITFTISGQTYTVWDNASGNFIHDEITTGTINYSTGAISLTFANPPDNGEDIDCQYATGAAGADWVVIQDGKTRNKANDADEYPTEDLREIILKNSGSSGLEEIYVGFRECKNAGLGYYIVNLTTYSDWLNRKVFKNATEAYDSAAKNYSQQPSVYFDLDEFPVYYFSDKNRIKGAFEVAATLWQTWYSGHGIRFGQPSNYRHPLYCCGSSYGSKAYSAVGNYSIINPPTSLYHCYYGRPDNTLSDESEVGNDIHVAPVTTLPTENYQQDPQLREVIISDTDLGYMLFELDEVKYFLGDYSTLQSTDEITHSGDTYIIFQWGSDTTHFVGMKKE